jgi:hypothetical protein
MFKKFGEIEAPCKELLLTYLKKVINAMTVA